MTIAWAQVVEAWKIILEGWYYWVIPIIIILYYKIHKSLKRLKRIDKKTRLISNYIIDYLEQEGKDPRKYM